MSDNLRIGGKKIRMFHLSVKLAKPVCKLISRVAFIGFLSLLFVFECSAQILTSDQFVQINKQGFGDRQNSFAWSMQWWNGKLYIGTGRSFVCFTAATTDLELGTNLYAQETADVECAPTPQDLDLRAEIWRYTPETQVWERVYQSPDDVPIPDYPGKFVARDIGFRSMVVFTEPDGTEALYVAGVSSRSINPGVSPPRILRSVDGVNFDPIPQDPGTFLGDLPVLSEGLKADRSFRSMAVYKDHLFVTFSDFRGVGGLIEAENPQEGNDAFRQVTPPDMKVWQLKVFNGFLYLGLETDEGYSVVKTDADEEPMRFITMVSNAGYQTVKKSKMAFSMEIFQERLYVGTDRPTELIRINKDDTWDLVVGPSRRTPQGWKRPISGFSTGFGNIFNGHFWRIQEHEGCLYLGTWDWSVQLRSIPTSHRRLRRKYGFDLFSTADGTRWTRISGTGFGDMFNYGIRSMASTPFGLFIGTANPYYGTEIWQGNFNY